MMLDLISRYSERGIPFTGGIWDRDAKGFYVPYIGQAKLNEAELFILCRKCTLSDQAIATATLELCKCY